MKLVLGLFLLGLPAAGYGGDAARKEQRFQEHKARKLERRAAKDEYRAKTTACINAASTKEQMKACREQNRAAREAFKAKYKKK